MLSFDWKFVKNYSLPENKTPTQITSCDDVTFVVLALNENTEL